MTDKKKLPVVGAQSSASDKPKSGKSAKAATGGWAAFTDGGAAPGYLVAARVILVVALAATIPTILGVEHGNRILWTVGIAALPLFWVIAGYHVWRRICPLAVVGQLGRLARAARDPQGRRLAGAQLPPAPARAAPRRVVAAAGRHQRQRGVAVRLPGWSWWWRRRSCRSPSPARPGAT
jgi:hypothetical protein